MLLAVLEFYFSMKFILNNQKKKKRYRKLLNMDYVSESTTTV